MDIPSWLNKEFMERVLRRSENDDSIRVTDVSTEPATGKGDNYMSDMIRVIVDYSYDQKARMVKATRSLIVKVAPKGDGIHAQLIEQAGLFDIEMKMMTTTLKEMDSILKDTKLGGDCLFTQQKDPPILIIEDLTPLGFRMADRQAGLDLQHGLLALKGLAKFHASSVAVCEKIPKYKDMYNKGIYNSDNPPEMTKFFTNGMKSLARAVASWPELDQSYHEKLIRIADVVNDRASDSSKRNDEEFNVINHGDFWVNNMLFKYDINGKAIDHTFVDFQLCVYGSPAIDLIYFFNTSPSEDVLLNHKDAIMEEYLGILSSTMRQLGCKTHPPSMKELVNAMNEREVYGFFAAGTVLPFTLIDKSEAQDLKEIMGEDESTYDNKGHSNEIYRKIMARRLRQWNDMKILDL